MKTYIAKKLFENFLKEIKKVCNLTLCTQNTLMEK